MDKSPPVDVATSCPVIPCYIYMYLKRLQNIRMLIARLILLSTKNLTIYMMLAKVNFSPQKFLIRYSKLIYLGL